ncbi:hypothetical protein R3P38DRAFT_1335033 [Favolaschia claudopus]|uniref:Uncharacterized protein n=1 Tax=Favolaschia claudopus TaxID=2862362 RepID=A0AAW0AUX2_9AGAR
MGAYFVRELPREARISLVSVSELLIDSISFRPFTPCAIRNASNAVPFVESEHVDNDSVKLLGYGDEMHLSQLGLGTLLSACLASSLRRFKALWRVSESLTSRRLSWKTMTFVGLRRMRDAAKGKASAGGFSSLQVPSGGSCFVREGPPRRVFLLPKRNFSDHLYTHPPAQHYAARKTLSLGLIAPAFNHRLTHFSRVIDRRQLLILTLSVVVFRCYSCFTVIWNTGSSFDLGTNQRQRSRAEDLLEARNSRKGRRE